MNNKPSILVFIDWYLPGFLAGGPIQSVASIVAHLSADFNFLIITSNADLDGVPYKGIKYNEWTELGQGNKIYYNSGRLGLKKLKTVTSLHFEAVYINSFFSFWYSILPLYYFKRKQPAKRIILAPRGMLGAGALGLKRNKKRFFLLVSRILGLHKKVNWHATSELEKTEIENTMGQDRNIKVVPNLPRHLEAASKIKKTSGELNVCFVARISQKKNLLFALQCLKEIGNGTIVFTIYGPKESEEYWALCENEIRSLPANITVRVAGPVAPSELSNAYATQHLLFLPTLNENFGHSIVEALILETPVIISDQTPWTDVEKEGAGFSLSLNSKAMFVDALKHFLFMSEEDFSVACASAKQYMTRRINIGSTITQYKDLFNGHN